MPFLQILWYIASQILAIRHSRESGNLLICNDFLDPRFHGDDKIGQIATAPY
jgi:hypothetical protein